MHDSWIDLARARRMTLENDRLLLESKLGKLWAYHTTAGEQPETVVQLELAEPIRIQLAVREFRESDLDDLWTDPAITFDEREFDDKVLVRGDEYVIRMLITKQVRMTLLSLLNLANEVALLPTIAATKVYGPPAPAPLLGTLMDHVEDLARAVRPTREKVGPAYR
jgi:hypothetical protein